MKALLKEDKVFGAVKGGKPVFEIVNVAGNNDDESKDSALDAVLSAITDQPDQTRTITLSCGKLTTGTTIKPWTAVLYLKGSEDTKAATYMQTIFRVQSPCFIGNKMKTECYVFDFDYQRTLKVVAETAKYSTIAKKASNNDDVEELTQDELDKKNMKAFLDCCNVKPLVPFTEDGAVMTEFNVESIFKRLESVYVDRLVTSGFNDKCLYDMTELNKIDKSIIDNIGDHGGAADHIEGDKRVKGDIPGFLGYALKDAVSESTSEVCCELGKYYESVGDTEEAAIWYRNALTETECILDKRCGDEIPQEGLARCGAKT